MKKVVLTGVVISLLLSFLSFAFEVGKAGKKDEVGESCKLYVKASKYRGRVKVLTITLTYLDDYVLSHGQFDEELEEEAANYLEDYQVFHVKVKGHSKDADHWLAYFSPRYIHIVQKKKQYEPEIKGIESGHVVRRAEKEGLLLFDKKLDMTKSMKIYYTRGETVKRTFKIDRGYLEKRKKWRKTRKAMDE